MDTRCAVFSMVVQAGVLLWAVSHGLWTAVYASFVIGGVVAGATSRNYHSELAEGFLAGTLGTVLAVLGWTVFLGGWISMNGVLASAGIRYGFQYQVIFAAVLASPVVGLANAFVAMVTANTRHRVREHVERLRAT